MWLPEGQLSRAQDSAPFEPDWIPSQCDMDLGSKLRSKAKFLVRRNGAWASSAHQVTGVALPSRESMYRLSSGFPRAMHV